MPSTQREPRGPVGFRLDAETTREVDRLFDRMIEAVGSLMIGGHRRHTEGSSGEF